MIRWKISGVLFWVATRAIAAIKRPIVLLSVWFFLLAPARGASVVVTVDANAAGPEISPDFIGLSYEMSAIPPDRDGRYFFSTNNKPLVALFRTLGIKSLRVGGNTATAPRSKCRTRPTSTVCSILPKWPG